MCLACPPMVRLVAAGARLAAAVTFAERCAARATVCPLRAIEDSMLRRGICTYEHPVVLRRSNAVSKTRPLRAAQEHFVAR